MKRSPFNHSLSTCLSLFVAVTLLLSLQGCRQDDPEPVNEEEVITTVEVRLQPESGGDVVTLRFFDPDGELGSLAPQTTVSGPLQSSTAYSAEITLLNETLDPVADISEEVAEEGHHHLFCFSVEGDLTIGYDDEDVNGLPIGLSTSWQTGHAGPAAVTIVLRHQDGTKTGQCPGPGETDVQVTFQLVIE